MPRSEINSQLGGDYSIESGAIVDEKQPCIVAIFAVNVSEGGVQDLRGIIKLIYLADRQTEEGPNSIVIVNT